MNGDQFSDWEKEEARKNGFILGGKTGTGKSTLLNALIGRDIAEVKKGVEGLIHISQISLDRITNPNEKLKVGDVVKAKIIELDIPNRKMELSIKELEREALQEKRRQEEANRVITETQIAEGISFVGEYKENLTAEEGNDNNE